MPSINYVVISFFTMTEMTSSILEFVNTPTALLVSRKKHLTLNFSSVCYITFLPILIFSNKHDHILGIQGTHNC